MKPHSSAHTKSLSRRILTPTKKLADQLTARLQLWNKYQRKLPRHSRSTVIYGHDSKLGLQLKRYSKGLDTGCVRGGRLTALVIEEGRWGGVKQSVVSVKCQDYRRKALAVDEKIVLRDVTDRRY